MEKHILNFTQKCDDWYEGGFESNDAGCRICNLHEKCQLDILRYVELQRTLGVVYRRTYELTKELRKLEE